MRGQCAEKLIVEPPTALKLAGVIGESAALTG